MKTSSIVLQTICLQDFSCHEASDRYSGRPPFARSSPPLLELPAVLGSRSERYKERSLAEGCLKKASACRAQATTPRIAISNFKAQIQI